MIRRLFWSGLLLGLFDLYLLYRVGCAWGLWAVLAVLILPAYFGLRVALRQGLHCVSRISEELSAGRNPSQKVAEAPLILISGLLLLMPGPLTTLLGVSLMVPGLRRFLAGRWLSKVPKAGVVEGARADGPHDGVFVRVVQIGGAGVPSDAQVEIKEAEGREVESPADGLPKALPVPDGNGETVDLK